MYISIPCVISGCTTTSSSPTGNHGNPAHAAKGHSNPYARPLSAKDIVSDLQNQQRIKKTSSATQMQSAPNGMFNQPGAGTPMFGFPMNAFMRPQSALRKEPFSKNENPKGNPKEAFSNKTGQAKANLRKFIPPTKLEREQDLSEIANGSDITGGQIVKKSFGPAKTETYSASVKVDMQSDAYTSSQSQVTVSSQTQKTSVDKINAQALNGIKHIADNSANNAKTIAYAKPVSSLPRPGSATNGSRTSPEVRNLNYTPTKPYHEVSNPTTDTQLTISATTKTGQTTETAISVISEVPMKGTTYRAPTNMIPEQKYSTTSHMNGHAKPVTSTAGTAYYRKESKADVMLHEQRPPAVGAPAKPLRGAEKHSNSNLTSGCEYDEAADDESEVPSG